MSGRTKKCTETVQRLSRRAIKKLEPVSSINNYDLIRWVGFDNYDIFDVHVNYETLKLSK